MSIKDRLAPIGQHRNKSAVPTVNKKKFETTSAPAPATKELAALSAPIGLQKKRAFSPIRLPVVASGDAQQIDSPRISVTKGQCCY
jgi:hypothetical protein